MSNESGQLPIPTHWRQTFREIVGAFAAADYRPAIPGVEPPSAVTAIQVQHYVSDYGATLMALPEETWQSSVRMWAGDHWDTLVDLWTKEEGRSDLVLHAQVTDEPNFSVRVHLVYVP
ncbi:hypothetical protein GGR77_003685 [Xanthomonas translucens]